jgi:malate/lactate dehydrogenase
MAAVETVLGNHQSVISVSTLMTGQYGVQDICLSLPCVIGVNGCERNSDTDDERSRRTRFSIFCCKTQNDAGITPTEMMRL